MQSTAELLHPSTPFLKGSEPSTPQEANPQLSLPSGPGAVLRGGRSTRTDDDRDFLAAAFKVRTGGVSATAVYRCLAYYASLSDRRIAYPSQSTIASYCDMSVRQVRRLLPKLEANGRIVCLERKLGRCSSTYVLVQPGQDVPLKPDKVSYEEGREELKQKAFISRGEAQSKGEITAPTDKPKEPIFSRSKDVPSQEQSKAPVEFKKPGQVAKLFKLQRKLGYTADDKQAKVFDGLPHVDKKRIIDKLEAEEQRAAAAGQVSNPPPKPLALRFRVGEVRKPLKKPSQENCRHVWYGPDSDGLSVCGICSAERGASD